MVASESSQQENKREKKMYPMSSSINPEVLHSTFVFIMGNLIILSHLNCKNAAGIALFPGKNRLDLGRSLAASSTLGETANQKEEGK